MDNGWGMVVRGGKERWGGRETCCRSLSKGATLIVWMVSMKMDLKTIQEVDFDFEMDLMGSVKEREEPGILPGVLAWGAVWMEMQFLRWGDWRDIMFWGLWWCVQFVEWIMRLYAVDQGIFLALFLQRWEGCRRKAWKALKWGKRQDLC